MEFTVWEDSQHHRTPNDFVNPWGSDRPYDPDSLVTFDDLDPHDTSLKAEHGSHHEQDEYSDDPTMHIPSGLPRSEFVGPLDLHTPREPTVFEDQEYSGRGHKRELSEAFTMRNPLVSPSHGEAYAGIGLRARAEGGDTSPDLTANMMRTPVREFSSYAFDSMRMRGSPSYGAAGLDSPLDSSALQSPYMAGHPFPALPRVHEDGGLAPDSPHAPVLGPDGSGTGHQLITKSGGATARKGGDRYRNSDSHSSTGSLSSNLSSVSLPVGDEPAKAAPASAGAESINVGSANTGSGGSGSSGAAEATPERGPQTPRASATKTRPKPKRTPSASASTSASATPRRSEAAGQTATPTPTQDGRRDSRKRIGKEQIEILEAFFHRNLRPEREDRMRLSAETNLEPRTVQIWFQNRRAKARSMKMPPSQADNSLFAQQYRAAAAAASNAAAAAAAAGAGPIPIDQRGPNPDPWGPVPPLTPGQQQRMMMQAQAGGPRHQAGYGTFQPQQRVYAAHGSPPPMGLYHQQLGGKPMYAGAQPMPGGGPPASMHQTHPHQMHPMHPVPNLSPGPTQMAGGSVGSGGQLMPAMQGVGGHSRSPSAAFEQFPYTYMDQADADPLIDGPMLYASKTGSTASLNSMGSSYGLSPLNPDLLMEGHAPPVYSPQMQSLQNSPEMPSPVMFPSFSGSRAASLADEPVQLSRSQSAYSFGDAWHPQQQQQPMGEMKRRRSLYGAVPTWGWADHNSGPVMQTSPSRTTPTPQAGGSGSNGVTLAASAAAAALRTRNRSSTQPAPRSRQPSIRLQLDESNQGSATLVVLPQDAGSPHSSPRSSGSESGGGSKGGARPGDMTPRSSSERLGDSGPEMTPDRAERAAERLLAERAAAATMGRRPSTRESRAEARAESRAESRAGARAENRSEKQ